VRSYPRFLSGIDVVFLLELQSEAGTSAVILEDSVSGTARCAWPREPGTTHELNRCLHVIRHVQTSLPSIPHPKKDGKKMADFLAETGHFFRLRFASTPALP